MSAYSHYLKKKKNDTEMQFKKYARKSRLEHVSVTLFYLGTFIQNVVNIKTCSDFSILANEIKNRDVAIS